MKQNVVEDISKKKDIVPVCFSIYMDHLDEDESFVCLGTKSATHSDGSSG